jgi:hypothetical protein
LSGIGDVGALRLLVERFALDDKHQIGANDLQDALRTSGLSIDHFALSVEHLAFYLASPGSEGINHPRAWALKKLRSGFYAEPAGFVSREEQQLREILEAEKAKAKRLKALKRERFEAGYDAWFLDLTPERKRDLFKDEKHVTLESPAPVVRGVLRRAYAVETGQLDLLVVLDAE